MLSYNPCIDLNIYLTCGWPYKIPTRLWESNRCNANWQNGLALVPDWINSRWLRLIANNIIIRYPHEQMDRRSYINSERCAYPDWISAFNFHVIPVVSIIGATISQSATCKDIFIIDWLKNSGTIRRTYSVRCNVNICSFRVYLFNLKILICYFITFFKQYCTNIFLILVVGNKKNF